jgi:hypothetical protein
MLAVLAVSLWAWTAAGGWSRIDLLELNWYAGFNPFSWMIVCSLVAVVAVARLQRGRRTRAMRPGAVVGAAVAMFCFAAASITVGVLIADALHGSWTPLRGNVEAITGRGKCGLATRLVPRDHLANGFFAHEVPTLLDPEILLDFPCATIPGINGGLVDLPRSAVALDFKKPLGSYDSPFAAAWDLYDVRSVARGPRGITVLSIGDTITGYARLNAISVR